MRKSDIISRVLMLFFVFVFLFPDLTKADEDVPVKDIFANTQAVFYAIWPCKIDNELIKETGEILKIDLLALKRPSVFDEKETYQKWFENYPSYPFGFSEEGKNSLINKLKSNGLILSNSIYQGQDDWGIFIAFRGKNFPNMEIRRYPTFAIIFCNRIENPLSSKTEYSKEIENLLEAIKLYFLNGSTANLLNTISASHAFYRYPLTIVTHINDLEKINYLGHSVEGMRVDEYWTSEELVHMGAIPHQGYNFTMLDFELFIAHNQVNELSIIIVPNKPPMIDNKYWRLANPINRDMERVFRFLSFIHVILPEYIKIGQNENDEGFDKLIKDLSANPSKNRINKIIKGFNTSVQMRETVLNKLKILNNKIEDICTVLDDAILWESKAINKEDFVTTTKEFGKKHTIPLLETDLNEPFIRSALRYDLGPNHTYDTRRILKQNQKLISQEIQRLEFSMSKDIKPRFERQLNFATTVYTLNENIKWSLIIAIIMLIFGNLLFAIFADDLKRKKIFPQLLKIWRLLVRNCKKITKRSINFIKIFRENLIVWRDKFKKLTKKKASR